jgi:hypothetical protein
MSVSAKSSDAFSAYGTFGILKNEKNENWPWASVEPAQARKKKRGKGRKGQKMT